MLLCMILAARAVKLRQYMFTVAHDAGSLPMGLSNLHMNKMEHALVKDDASYSMQLAHTLHMSVLPRLCCCSAICMANLKYILPFNILRIQCALPRYPEMSHKLEYWSQGGDTQQQAWALRSATPLGLALGLLHSRDQIHWRCHSTSRESTTPPCQSGWLILVTEKTAEVSTPNWTMATSHAVSWASRLCALWISSSSCVRSSHDAPP